MSLCGRPAASSHLTCASASGDRHGCSHHTDDKTEAWACSANLHQGAEGGPEPGWAVPVATTFVLSGELLPKPPQKSHYACYHENKLPEVPFWTPRYGSGCSLRDSAGRGLGFTPHPAGASRAPVPASRLPALQSPHRCQAGWLPESPAHQEISPTKEPAITEKTSHSRLLQVYARSVFLISTPKCPGFFPFLIQSAQRTSSPSPEQTHSPSLRQPVLLTKADQCLVP